MSKLTEVFWEVFMPAEDEKMKSLALEF